MHIDKTQRNLVFKGIYRGLLGSAIGSCLFTIFEAAFFVLYNDMIKLDSTFLLVLLVIMIAGFVVTTPFAILGSIWLAFGLFKTVKTLSRRIVFGRGFVAGFKIGTGLCILLIGSYFSRGNLYVIFTQSIAGISICAITGGWLGLKLMDDIAYITDNFSLHTKNASQ